MIDEFEFNQLSTECKRSVWLPVIEPQDELTFEFGSGVADREITVDGERWKRVRVDGQVLLTEGQDVLISIKNGNVVQVRRRPKTE